MGARARVKMFKKFSKSSESFIFLRERVRLVRIKNRKCPARDQSKNFVPKILIFGSEPFLRVNHQKFFLYFRFLLVLKKSPQNYD